MVDGEAQDQIRARNAFLNANWHDVTITPNLKGVNEIFDSERKDTDWGRNVRQWTRHMQNFGWVWVKSYLDKSRIHTASQRRKPAALSFYWTPECMTIKKKDGCWYVVHGEKITGQWIKENRPNFKIEEISADDNKSPRMIGLKQPGITTYEKTRFFDKMEVYLDDAALEEIPFDPEEFNARVAALMQPITNPTDPQKKVFPNAEEDNHPKWIKAYQDWLDERTKFWQEQEEKGLMTPEDVAYANKVVDLVDQQIILHQEEMDQSDLPEDMQLPDGKRQKYPFGRHIETISGKVSIDEPNPYEFEWRRLFHYIANEQLPERVDGRGDAEILWNTEKNLSTQLSHMGDDELLNGHKKAWFPFGRESRNRENWLR